MLWFIDTGIDYTHPAFIAADGESRIQAIWDQTLRDGDPPAGFRYGREFTNQEITDALSAENPSLALPTWDESGHGTFLAGVAAGNISRENDFSGVAPQAELLIVKCKECKQLYCEYYRIISGVPAYQENDIMAGISYLLDQANRLERPIVICIGMGTNMGNHGGDSRLGYMMDRYSGIPGVCMVVPAGNEGNARHHFYSLADARTYEFVEVDIDVEDNYFGFIAEVWWRSPGLFDIEVVSPSGDTFPRATVYPTITRMRKFSQENTTLEIYFGVILEQTRDQVIFLRFENSKPGIWKIRIYPNERILTGFHVWLPLTEFLDGDTFFLRPDPDTTICEPGNSPRVLTMTAYNDLDGSLFLRAGRGFTTQNEVKPDLAAPGVDIYGPLPRGRYGMLTGTSVAAALTAGISALIYEQFPDNELSGVTIIEILIQGANRTDRLYPSREWGYGMVDIYQSIIQIQT